jgi:hypothetical protein
MIRIVDGLFEKAAEKEKAQSLNPFATASRFPDDLRAAATLVLHLPCARQLT